LRRLRQEADVRITAHEKEKQTYNYYNRVDSSSNSHIRNFTGSRVGIIMPDYSYFNYQELDK